MNETGNDGQTPFPALSAAERSDRGRVRENNEDVVLSLPGAGLFLVADGMGGAREGEVAAKAVVDHLKEACADPALPLPARVRRCKEAANAASLWIRQYASRQGNPGMGTTVAVLLFDPADPAAAACLHAGDSRLYRLRRGVLEQLTQDHSMASLAGAAHEGQVPSLFRGVITRAVGVRRTVELETTFLDVAKGDLYLLCTDGLHGLVPRDRLARLLAEEGDLEHKAVALVEAALHAGGDDNITVLLVRADGAPEAAGGDEAAPAMPPPGRENRPRERFGNPLISLLLLALLGLAAVLFVFRPWEQRPALPPGELDLPALPPPIPAPEAAPAVAPEPPPPEPAPVEPPPPAPEEAAVKLSPDEIWAREKAEVADSAEKIKARHQTVLAAFASLADWSGKPLAPPSLMIAGRPEERPDAWLRYLASAQVQWYAAASGECARLRREAEALDDAALAALWLRARGTPGEEPAYRALAAAWQDWRRELVRMDRFLGGVDPAVPFLYTTEPGPFVAGPGAAELGDRAWGGTLPLVNELWKRRVELAELEGADRADEIIRQANALWESYARRNHLVRPWRQGMDPERVRPFFERLAGERGEDKPAQP